MNDNIKLDFHPDEHIAYRREMLRRLERAVPGMNPTDGEIDGITHKFLQWLYYTRTAFQQPFFKLVLVRTIRSAIRDAVGILLTADMTVEQREVMRMLREEEDSMNAEMMALDPEGDHLSAIRESPEPIQFALEDCVHRHKKFDTLVNDTFPEAIDEAAEIASDPERMRTGLDRIKAYQLRIWSDLDWADFENE